MAQEDASPFIELTGPQVRRDAAARRHLILAAARTLFVEQGVEAVQMQAIARAAGVGQGTLYRRFRHKGEVCAALIADNARALGNDLASLAADQRTDPASLVREAIDLIVDFNETNHTFLAGMRGFFPQGAPMSLFRGALYPRLHASFAALLQRGQADGTLHIPDLVVAVDLLLSYLVIDMYLFQREIRHRSPAEIVTDVMTVWFGGFLRPLPN